MKILAIETSCDETGVAIVEADGDKKEAIFTVLGNALLSQVEIHKPYGGVFPSLAKREHAKNLVPILHAALEEAEMLIEETQELSEETRDKIAEILSREPDLCAPFLDFISESKRPDIDAIAVTAGPGLEPALWVGINFAKALAFAWDKPLVAVNHMEGHLLAALAQEAQGDTSHPRGITLRIQGVALPLLALLISGGHTELILMKKWLEYERLGGTRDDAVGEAFDKVARMLGLPYPGGPEISKLAEKERRKCEDIACPTSDVGHAMSYMQIKLPRPMIHDPSYDFSFAGLKTAVLNILKKRSVINEIDKARMAREFEDAAADVLLAKTVRALRETGAKTLAIGGGVCANKHIRHVFKETLERNFPDVALYMPNPPLATDNAVMVALAGFYHASRSESTSPDALTANGNLHLV